MKDIFIDADIANRFAKPPDESYRNLIKWLLKNDKGKPELNAILMLSDKLIGEYKGGNVGCCNVNSIAAILNTVLIELRYVKLKNDDLKHFIKTHITKKIIKDVITCNKKDWWHFPLVFYSDRKMAIVFDNKFRNDLLNFPKFSKGVSVFENPEEKIYL